MALAVAGAISLGLTTAQFPAAIAGVRGARLKHENSKISINTRKLLCRSDYHCTIIQEVIFIIILQGNIGHAIRNHINRLFFNKSDIPGGE